MPHTLVVSASNWNAKLRVSCTFVVKANNAVLSPMPGKPQFFQLPDNTVVVEIAATPTAPAQHWPNTVLLAPDASGALVVAKDSLPFAHVKSVPVPPDKRSTTATCKLSRFRDVSKDFATLLASPPTSRLLPKSTEFKRPADVTVPDDEKAALVAQYGSWAPANWDVPALASAAYLDAAPHVAGTPLKFTKATVDPGVQTVILEMQGATTPRIFGVTWPTNVPAPVPPPSFLFYLRQTSGQNVIADGMFQGKDIAGAYPLNFDYAERCLYESLHFGQTALQTAGTGILGVALRPKGAPYQIARSGRPVVAVYPVLQAYPVDQAAKEVSELVPMDNIERILEEIQAFMFWRLGFAEAPPEVSRVAISTFSSANWVLEGWLRRGNLSSHFLAKKLVALYLFDPPNPDTLLPLALSWSKIPGVAGSKKQIRFYGRGMDSAHPEISPIHESLLGPVLLAQLKNGAQHPPVPFIETNPDGHTVALLPFSSWQPSFTNLGMTNTVANWDAHHLIPATMLTHALRQGDL